MVRSEQAACSADTKQHAIWRVNLLLLNPNPPPQPSTKFKK